MADWVMTTVERLGATGVGLLMLLENIFPPIPSELIMPLAGFVSARGVVMFWPAMLAGTAGSLAGAAGWYALGRYMGEHRLRAWIAAHGRWLTVSPRDLDRLNGWFIRHGGAAVFLGRLVPGVRTLISIPAGFSSMPLVPFLVYSAVGTALWTIALGYAGHVLGEHYRRANHMVGVATWVVVGGIVVLYAVRVARWERSAS